MKLVILAPANVMHTVRWANAMYNRGLEVHVISMHPMSELMLKGVKFYKLKIPAPMGYFGNSFQLKRILQHIEPDIVNVHFASGYGTLGRTIHGMFPYLLSVWGSDVYDFPRRSRLHRIFLRKNLQKTTLIASTSHAMARVTKEIHKDSDIIITPFGIDATRFYKFKDSTKENVEEFITIGTVKTLKHLYGIDILIKAFAKVRNEVEQDTKLSLMIVGGGPQLGELKNLTIKLGIDELVQFIGQVSHDEVPNYLNQLDIYVALSREESFGVAILEASASELPVVVSDADGPAEVTEHGSTGLIVPRENVDLAAKAIKELVTSKSKRHDFGKAGRKHVLENYTWERSVDNMLEAYAKTIEVFCK